MIQCFRIAALRLARTSCRSQFPCCWGPWSTFGQSRCLPRCSTKGSPHQLTYRPISKGYDMVGEVGDTQIIVNLHVTSVTGCNGSNTNTLGLQKLQFLDK